jgi:thiamine pyrophosphokinase
VDVVIVAGATLDAPLGADLLVAADLVVAADHGADALLAAGVLPHVLVGDMDSIEPASLARLTREGIELVVTPSEKDETDLELALRLAVGRGAQAIRVWGALGGPRLDHLFGAAFLLGAGWLRAVDVRLLDSRQEVMLVGRDRTVSGRPGDTFSLLPLSREVETVTTEGLRYPLRGETLYQNASRGVSNELVQRQARVTHGAGELLLVHFRKGDADG